MVKMLAKDTGPPSAASEEEIEAYSKRNDKLSTFWKQIVQVTSTNNESSMLVNMSCDELTLPAAIPSGDEQKVNFFNFAKKFDKIINCLLLCVTLLQAQYGSEAFDKLADMIYNTLDQYGIYQRYLRYTDYNKLMLHSVGMATTAEAGGFDN